jgi:hypothetical protein
VPTERRPLHRAHRSRLDGEAEMELQLGPSHRGSVFESEADRQWAWSQHRGRLMELFARNGRRPWAWWIYEAGRPHPGDRQASTLYEMEQLAGEELEECLGFWRAQFDRSFDRDFFYTERPGQFCTGWQARERHFEWADIPPVLLAEWLAAAPVPAA